MSRSGLYSDVFALPNQLYLGNYITIFTEGAMGLYFRNSLLIAVISVAGLLVSSSLAAYAFATFRFQGSTPLFMILLLGLIFISLGWSSFGIMVLRNFVQSVPRDVKDAARVDGAGHWQMFSQIMLPLARLSVSTIAIFCFMWVWNEFIYPLVYMRTPEKYTVPLGVLFFNGRYTIEWGLQMAALAVATIAPRIVYYAFRKPFIRGILGGALKG